MTEGKRDIIRKLIEEYDVETATDNHLDYEKSERSYSDDYRNGYKSKRINSSYGNMDNSHHFLLFPY